MEKTISKNEKGFLLLSAIFVTLLVVSNIIASKVILIGDLMAPAAVLCYALTFAISDTLAEIWGKERTTFIVRVGFVTTIVSALMIKLAIVMPGAPFWQNQSEYSLILGSNIRIVLASMLAYFVSQHHDVWAFHFWKDKTHGKHLWLRNNLSTIVSQVIDTVVFIIIAFYGTGAPIMTLIINQYLVKVTIAVLDTPVVYILVNYIKGNLGIKKLVESN